MPKENEQTLAPKEENEQTPAQNKEEETKEETYTKTQLTELIQKEVGKVTAKHSKKYEDLKAELEAERRKSLPDPEKVKAEMADKDKAIAEREAKILALEAKGKKREALDAAKLSLPENISINDLLELMPGNSDEEIAKYVDIFKKSYPQSKGLGTGTQTGQKQTLPTIEEELNAELAKGSKADPTKLIYLRGKLKEKG